MVSSLFEAIEDIAPPNTERQRIAVQAVVDDLTAGNAVLVVRRRDGTEYPLDGDDIRGVLAILTARAHGQRVSIVAHELLISPQKAASLLGVSRPMVYRYIETGDLVATRVGPHWRLRAGQVLALACRRAQQAEAIDKGFAAALAEGPISPVDAKEVWRESSTEEREFARELVADLLDPNTRL